MNPKSIDHNICICHLVEYFDTNMQDSGETFIDIQHIPIVD